MSSTHTPGPWTATKGRTQWNVRAPNLHMTLLDTRHGHPELKKANAMLAAAAPDLLAACEAGLQELQTLAHSFGLENFDSNPAVKQLRSAIAKATGGSQ